MCQLAIRYGVRLSLDLRGAFHTPTLRPPHIYIHHRSRDDLPISVAGHQSASGRYLSGVSTASTERLRVRLVDVLGCSSAAQWIARPRDCVFVIDQSRIAPKVTRSFHMRPPPPPPPPPLPPAPPPGNGRLG
jgi:hypothetical protein